MRNQDKVLTRTMIAEHVWDYNFDTFTNVIDVYINHLRKKVDKGRQKRIDKRAIFPRAFPPTPHNAWGVGTRVHGTGYRDARFLLQ